MKKQEIEKKFNIKSKEEFWLKYWENHQVYKFDESKLDKTFVIDTPPPYVSADHLHSGHIMSYCQAEFVVRYKRMQGFNVFYPMGFDDNGLPTERFVEKKYNVDKNTISKEKFIKLCLEETKKGALNYKNLWQALGISMDWSKTYSTISDFAMKVSQSFILKMFEKGYLYQDNLPVLWCPKAQTALAQADLDDLEEKTFMNYINFKSFSGDDLQIATTRPELIFGCVALFVNPNDTRYESLIGKQAVNPLDGSRVPIKACESVEIDKGTGLMMVCTWGDQEDVIKWRDFNLNTKIVLDKQGLLTENCGEYAGMDCITARKAILEKLKTNGDLVKQEEKVHNVKIHDRSGAKVEFILSEQWFLKTVEFKEDLLKQAEKINWFPSDKKQIFDLWVDGLKWDWCVSRQRYYGVFMPAWNCVNCEHVVFAKAESLPVNPYNQKCIAETCPKCGSKEFAANDNVLDTWVTSSCTQYLADEFLGLEDKLFPPDVRPNAFEIIRTWDFYSILNAFLYKDEIPFKNLMISGHGLDDKGIKISKRLKNYVEAEKLLEDYPADSIRYWAAKAKLGKNHRFSKEEILKGNKTIKKLWSVMNFLNLNAEFIADHFDENTLEDADKWILGCLDKTIFSVNQYFEEFEYSKALSCIEDFFWNDLTDNYIEFIKYRVFGDDLKSKKSALTNLDLVFFKLIRLFAPFMPFITEEIYQVFYKDRMKFVSLHNSIWPQEVAIKKGDFNLNEFLNAINLISEIRAYKSQNSISLGEFIPEYKVENDCDILKYGTFICNVIRVEKLF